MRGSWSGRRTGWTGTLVVAALAGGALASPGSGTQPGCWEKGIERAGTGGSPGLANTTIEPGADWEREASRLVRFADLRPMCDPARREALRLAARYYGFAGDYERAAEAAFRAGEQGRLTGHLTEAAEAFITAGTYALEAGDRDCAERAARQAALLAESPLLAPAQRIAIRGRADSLLETAG